MAIMRNPMCCLSARNLNMILEDVNCLLVDVNCLLGQDHVVIDHPDHHRLITDEDICHRRTIDRVDIGRDHLEDVILDLLMTDVDLDRRVERRLLPVDTGVIVSPLKGTTNVHLRQISEVFMGLVIEVILGVERLLVIEVILGVDRLIDLEKEKEVRIVDRISDHVRPNLRHAHLNICPEVQNHRSMAKIEKL